MYLDQIGSTEVGGVGPSPLVQTIARSVPASLAHGTEAERGAVYTRKEVVDAILDLVGYVSSKPLYTLSILEPGAGKGDFLLPTVSRLLESYLRDGGGPGEAAVLRGCILAVEISDVSCRRTASAVGDLLMKAGVPASVADDLVESWFLQGDFLLVELAARFDFVVGNPPYIRQERIPPSLLEEYRRRYTTLYDRSDIYVPFIERSLSLLAPGGTLGFICADRWMKNKYGGPLRKFVSSAFSLKFVVGMDSVDAFTSEVIAYPAIFVIANSVGVASTRVGTSPRSFGELSRCVDALLAPKPSAQALDVPRVVEGSAPWLIEHGGVLKTLRRLEEKLPLLEEVGCKVGIGVATGADKVYLGDLATLDVEDSRKLPLVTTWDIQSGRIIWRGLGVVNPFEVNGQLADPDAHPRFKKFLELNREVICGRNVAKRSKAGWFRTIDRIYPDLVKVPKLLIPDIKGEANVVFDEGNYYPHHNLYYITSQAWDLRALQAVLRSSVARLFVASYSTRMRGGYLRYQAQYLRRIRLPRWESVPEHLRSSLVRAAESLDSKACDSAALELYGVTAEEVRL